MSDVFKLIGLTIFGGFGVGFAVICTAVATSWKPEHTNALVYGLLSLSGLAVVGVVGVLGGATLLGVVWIMSKRQQGVDPTLRNEFQLLRNTGQGISLLDRILARTQPQHQLTDTRAGTYVDLED